MNFGPAAAEVFVPDGSPVDAALGRTTHLGVGAHQDDLEFMAFHGITECFGKSNRWFCGVTCTNGAGSARTGEFAKVGDPEMAALRREEQNKAARLGEYGAMLQLGYSSADARGGAQALVADLRNVLIATRPEVVYTHNLADKHPTHVAVALAVIEALRSLPKDARPQRVIGCEVWRDLDWLPDADKVAMDVTGYEKLAGDLAACFQSQIAGGKRYDLAVPGRRSANATFSDPHSPDRATQVIHGMDLTLLAEDISLSPATYVYTLVDRFRSQVRAALRGGNQETPTAASATLS